MGRFSHYDQTDHVEGGREGRQASKDRELSKGSPPPPSLLAAPLPTLPRTTGTSLINSTDPSPITQALPKHALTKNPPFPTPPLPAACYPHRKLTGGGLPSSLQTPISISITLMKSFSLAQLFFSHPIIRNKYTWALWKIIGI